MKNIYKRSALIVAALAMCGLAAFAFFALSQRELKPVPHPGNPGVLIEEGPYETKVERDISYATVNGIVLALDLYMPEGATVPTPVLIFAHGGGFKGGNKDEKKFAELGPSFAAHGYAFASINYRLSGQAAFPAPIHDFFGAIRYLRANAEKYNLDKNRIAVSGSSAGSILSTMVAVMANEPGLQGEVGGNLGESNGVQAAFPISGEIYSAALSTFDDRHEELGLAAFSCSSFTAPDCAEKFRLYFPEYHSDAEDPPFFITQGAKDEVVPPQNAIDLVAAMKAAGIEAILIINPEQGHGAENGIMHLPEILEFLDEVFSR